MFINTSYAGTGLVKLRMIIITHLVLPIFGKIFEKILYNRLYSFFTSKSVIYKKQFGFRKKHSTGHAINYSINKIIDELQTRNHVIGICIDLSKAFDTIDHNKLVSKLEHYGIRGTCLTPPLESRKPRYQVLSKILLKIIF